MGRWRKCEDQTNIPSENGPPEPFSALTSGGTPLTLSDTAEIVDAPAPAPGMLSEESSALPQYCPECGGRLCSSAAYIPKFCTQCGHRLADAAAPALVSGLDALLAATAAAKAGGGPRSDHAASAANVTFMGASRTLMGVPRSSLHTQTLMGVPRTDLYKPPTRTRTGTTRARVQDARRSGAVPLRIRYAPPPVIPAPPVKAVPKETRQSGGVGIAVAVFITLLLLAVCAAAATFWLCRRGIIALPV